MESKTWIVRGVLASMFALTCAQAQSQVTITEFMASNATTLRDGDREYPDWIELYNDGSTEVDLEGWALTDSPETPYRWVFPSADLAPGGYLLVHASGKDRTVPGKALHTNFSLDAAGEYLALRTAEGEIVSEYANYPSQRVDVSYGHRLGREVYFDDPTPGEENVGGFNEFVADTKFSHDRGLYTTPFEVSIMTATADAIIRYTTDGSPPSADRGSEYAGPIPVNGSTVLRALAIKEGMYPSNIDTQTYLFLDDVVRQSPDGTPPPGWPRSWGSNTRDYGMDPDIVNHPEYGPKLEAALKSLPSFSVVMDLDDLFDSRTGIYANPGNDGRSWERPCSMELLHPDGRQGFQIDCGIRIRGGFSRSTGNPKHAFRLFFRDVYGAPKLKYPLFGDEGTDTFDNIDLRTFQNYSWSFQGDDRGIFIRDQVNRDAQLEMGHQAERGNFYHLYVNGHYWGIYNTAERTEASYAETYYGGNKEDYDVIKVEAGPYTINATDGNLQAWRRLYSQAKSSLSSDAAFERVQGNHPDGGRNPEYERLIELDNLIDYMLINLYGGNLDAPISNFLGNTRPNNWYGIRSRVGEDGFRFFVHDAEHTLLNVNQNRLGPWSAGDSSVSYSNPQWVWQKMWNNREFRIRMADGVHRHFFHGGALTPEAWRARILRRKAELDLAVIAESARWGDAKQARPLTREDWLREMDHVLEDYVPRRTGIVLNQLRSKNLYPEVAAPAFQRHGGDVEGGFELTMSVARGTIYYTIDGSDPRLRGGEVSPTARRYADAVPIHESTLVKARAHSGDEWSALNEATFTVVQTYSNLLITEILYHPRAEESVDGDRFEFLELKNVNPFAIDLSGVRFAEGIRYEFPLGSSLEAGAFLVLARDGERFHRRYPGVRLDGVYDGGLANNGERITLSHATGDTLFSVTFSDRQPWPETADGRGFSIVPREANRIADPDDAGQWRASSAIDGSPGRDDAPNGIAPVVVNEVLTHTDAPQLDAVELFNPGDEPAAIGHWYLTDDRSEPRKFRFPASTIIPPGGFLVLDETHFNPVPGVYPSFSLSSWGEAIYLHSADAEGRLTGYSDGFRFGAAANDVSFGRYENSVGEVSYPSQVRTTLGGPNAGPGIGPVVFNEVHYHPASGDEEFIELRNLTDDPLPLYDPLYPANTWRIEGIAFRFPEGAQVPANGLLLVVGGEPEAFRARYFTPAEVPVLGPYSGVLQDNGESLRLQRPDTPDLGPDGEAILSFVTVDAVRYNDKSPWPEAAAGRGSSLERLTPARYADDPRSWRASAGISSPGRENDGNRPPIPDAGEDRQIEADLFPTVVKLEGGATDDGLPETPGGLQTRWIQIDGPEAVYFAEPRAASTSARFPGVGVYLLRLLVSDGDIEAGDDLLVTITRPSDEQTFVSAGTEWRYLDDGSDQGVAWRQPGFKDDSWKAGRAQLGYGDGDEATVVSFGGRGSDKQITTYFRRSFAVDRASSVISLHLQAVRDDGIAVYLNGTEVMRDNLPEGDIGFRSRANGTVGGGDESAFVARVVDPSLLVEGLNLLAVEIHQVSPTSSDISFDLKLEARRFPVNQTPTVDAGPDFEAATDRLWPLLAGFTDDALPNPPGVPSFLWSMVSGPGSATFADAMAMETTVSFPAPGNYVLRLEVDDGGAPAVADEVAVTVAGGNPVPLIEALTVSEGPPRRATIRFSVAPGFRYQVQYRDSLEPGEWTTFAEIGPFDQVESQEVGQEIDSVSPTRFYRLVAE